MRMLIEFEKSDRVRHLGLLDMQRTMQRALKRSQLPVAYSKGFNPHIQMSFASALSSGVSGFAEIVDVALAEDRTEEECLAKLQMAMPEAMPVHRVHLVDSHFPKSAALLQRAAYDFQIDPAAGTVLIAGIPAFLAQNEIMALRKSKSAEKMVDIRPMIHELNGSIEGEEAHIRAQVSFTESATLKPQLLMTSLCGFLSVPEPHCMIRRTGLYGLENGRPVSLMDIKP